MRGTRIKVIGKSAVYHCVTRVVGGQMLLDTRGKEVLRKQLWQVSDFCGLEIITYCLMTNHFHVLVRVPDPTIPVSDQELIRRYHVLYAKRKGAGQAVQSILEAGGEAASECRSQLLSRMGDISVFMKELKQRFSIWFNKSNKRYGTLWAERFKSVLVESEPHALRAVAAYIDLNPVRAGLVDDPSDYRFCGYAEALGGSKCAQEGLSYVVAEKRWHQARGPYRQLLMGVGQVKSKAGDATLDQGKARETIREGGKLPLSQLLRLRVRYFTDGAILGSSEYVQSYFEEHRSHFGAKRQDGPRKLQGSDEWGDLRSLRQLRVDPIS